MAFLPPTPLTLTGGCMCTALRYEITIPALPSRPLLPRAAPTPINPAGDTIPTRLPLIDIDHCTPCRRACGSLFQCWFICQQSWVSFTLQPRPLSLPRAGSASYTEPFDAADGIKYSCAEVVDPSEEVLERTYLGHWNSSENVHRCFCSRCGTGVTYCASKERGSEWTLGGMVDVAVGTLDTESLEVVRPDRHGWWDLGIGWVKELVGAGWLKRHEGPGWK